jgi:hypothetical protein
MEIVQWVVAAGTTIFVATIGYFQWRTAQQKAVLDLFDRRHEIFEVVRKAVGQMISSSHGFNHQREIEFMQAMERAYFFFGDDVQDYLKQLWSDILTVRAVDTELENTQAPDRHLMVERRRLSWDRIAQFYRTGQPLFGRYMRFSQTVPSGFWSTQFKRIAAETQRVWKRYVTR